MEAAQYLGSAAQDLGFFHVDVQEEVNRNDYLKFLDNWAILTVEEVEIEEGEIVDTPLVFKLLLSLIFLFYIWSFI
jgi:hypothetical protein